MDYFGRSPRALSLFLYLAVIISLGLVGMAGAIEDAGQVRNVSPVDVLPYGYLLRGTPVTAEFSINAMGSYPSDGEEQLSTDLDNPSWTYTIIVNDVENLRPVFSGSSIAISGFELCYKTTD